MTDIRSTFRSLARATAGLGVVAAMLAASLILTTALVADGAFAQANDAYRPPAGGGGGGSSFEQQLQAT